MGVKSYFALALGAVLLTMGSLPLSAQTSGAVEVYPIRVNHKVGFMKCYLSEEGIFLDTIIAPRYDYIADEHLPWNTVPAAAEPSPYRLFELNERVGLLSEYLQEVLPNHFKRIRPLSEQYFALEIDSLFVLADLEQRIFFDSTRYDNICPAPPDEDGQTRFFVQQGTRWGLRRLDGETLIPPKYLQIQAAEAPGFFKVFKQAEGWQAADRKGQLIGPGPAEAVVVLDSSHIGLYHGGRWSILSKQKGKWTALKEAVSNITRINSQLAALHSYQTNKVELWNYRTQRTLITEEAKPKTPENTPDPSLTFAERPEFFYPWFYPLDEGYAIFSEDMTPLGYAERLIDRSGANRSPAYANILPTQKEGLYKTIRADLWGLIAPDLGGEVLPCAYTNIGPFEGDIAILRQGNALGAVSFRNGRIDTLSAVYERIERRGASLWAQFGDQAAVYELTEAGQLSMVDFHENLTLVPRSSLQIKEAAPISKQRAAPYQPQQSAPSGKLSVKELNDALWLVKTRQRLLGGEEELWRMRFPVGTPPPSNLNEVGDRQLFYALEGPAKPLSPTLARFTGQKELPCVQFFDNTLKQLAPELDIAGLRPFDRAYPFTAFLSTDGQMGLIGRDGQVLHQDEQPLRYTYIGPFEAGRARVCTDAQWHYTPAQTDPPQPYKFQIGTPYQFCKDLGISASAVQEGLLFLTDAPGKRRRWGYIDEQGQWLMEVDAGYIENFHWQDSTALIAKENGKKDAYGHPDAGIGVIDYTGQAVLPADYDQIVRMADYYFLSVGGTPTFSFNQKGHEIFVNRTRMRPFSDGLSLFQDQQGRWGYADRQGGIAIPPQYLKARPFSDGLALVADSSGFCKFIGPQGQIAFATDFTIKQLRGLGDFHDGRCWFKGRGWAWGMYDRSGTVVLPPSAVLNLGDIELPPEEEPYVLPMDFSHGLATVQWLGPDRKTHPAVLDSSGQVIVDGRDYAYIGPFKEHGAALYQLEENGLFGLIGQTGQQYCPPSFLRVEPFRNGLAAAQGKDGRWGLIRPDGSPFLPMQYAKVGAFSEGLVAVKPTPQSEWQYVDTARQVRIQGPFGQATPFQGGIAYVSYEQQPLAINKAGEPILLKGGTPAFLSEGILGVHRFSRSKPATAPPSSGYYTDASGNNLFGQEFSEISPFQLGVAAVRPISPNPSAQMPLGAINRRGVMVVPPKYRRLHIQPDGNIIINPQRFYGMANKSGQVLVPADFDRIDELNEPGLFRLERGEHIGYIWIDEGQVREVWALQN